METKTLVGLGEARFQLYKVMIEKPDFVYAPDGGTCRYAPTTLLTDPESKRISGCMIGEMYKAENGDYPDWTPTSIAAAGYAVYTPEALQYLQMAQSAQDKGATWRAAFEQAEAWFQGYTFWKSTENV